MRGEKNNAASAAVSANSEALNKDNFEAFFKENFVRLCLFCQYRFGFDTDQAREIVHNSFIKLWENRSLIGIDTPLLPYLSAMICNQSLDAIRHNKIKLKHKRAYLRSNTDNFSIDGSSDVDLRQLRKDIGEALETLPAQMRAIFELSRFSGLKYAEIALRLGISSKTVETQMGRALQKLRQNLKHYLGMLLLSAWFVG